MSDIQTYPWSGEYMFNKESYPDEYAEWQASLDPNMGRPIFGYSQEDADAAFFNDWMMTRNRITREQLRGAVGFPGLTPGYTYPAAPIGSTGKPVSRIVKEFRSAKPPPPSSEMLQRRNDLWGQYDQWSSQFGPEGSFEQWKSNLSPAYLANQIKLWREHNQVNPGTGLPDTEYDALKDDLRLREQWNQWYSSDRKIPFGAMLSPGDAAERSFQYWNQNVNPRPVEVWGGMTYNPYDTRGPDPSPGSQQPAPTAPEQPPGQFNFGQPMQEGGAQYPYPQGGDSWYRLYQDMQGRMDKRAEYDRWYAGEHRQQNPYYRWASAQQPQPIPMPGPFPMPGKPIINPETGGPVHTIQDPAPEYLPERNIDGSIHIPQPPNVGVDPNDPRFRDTMPKVFRDPVKRRQWTKEANLRKGWVEGSDGSWTDPTTGEIKSYATPEDRPDYGRSVAIGPGPIGPEPLGYVPAPQPQTAVDPAKLDGRYLLEDRGVDERVKPLPDFLPANNSTGFIGNELTIGQTVLPSPGPWPQQHWGGDSWYRLYQDMQGRMDKRAEYDRWYAGEHRQQNPYYRWASAQQPQPPYEPTLPPNRVHPETGVPLQPWEQIGPRGNVQGTSAGTGYAEGPSAKDRRSPGVLEMRKRGVERQAVQARTMKQQAPQARKQSVQPQQGNPRTQQYEGGRR